MEGGGHRREDFILTYSAPDGEENPLCEAKAKARRKSKSKPKKRPASINVRYEVSTEFPDEEVVRILAGLRIDTPHDPGKTLRIEVERRLIDDLEDDQQT